MATLGLRQDVCLTDSRGKSFERCVIRISESLWPWPERRLAVMVAVLAFMDYASTIGFLKLGGGKAYEAGILASRALGTGGLAGLLLTDIAAVGTLLLAALCIRQFCLRTGLGRYARAAFILMLLPYAMAAAGAVCNNLAIILL